MINYIFSDMTLPHPQWDDSCQWLSAIINHHYPPVRPNIAGWIFTIFYRLETLGIHLNGGFSIAILGTTTGYPWSSSWYLSQRSTTPPQKNSPHTTTNRLGRQMCGNSCATTAGFSSDDFCWANFGEIGSRFNGSFLDEWLRIWGGNRWC